MTTANEHSFAFKAATVEQVMAVNGILVYNGATTHIVRGRSKFIQFDNSFVPEEHTIELADGSKSHAVVQCGVAVMYLQAAPEDMFRKPETYPVCSKLPM